MTDTEEQFLYDISDDGDVLDLDGCEWRVDPTDAATVCSTWTPATDCKVELVSSEKTYPYRITNLSNKSSVMARSDQFEEILKLLASEGI